MNIWMKGNSFFNYVPWVDLSSMTTYLSWFITWSYRSLSLLGNSFLLQMTIWPIKAACLYTFPLDKNWLMIQSPISLLCVEIAMNVGSIRFCLIETRDASNVNDYFIFSIVFGWLAITLSMLEKSPEHIIDKTSRAVFFYSSLMYET